MNYLDADTLAFQRRRTGWPVTLVESAAKFGAFAPVAFQFVRAGVVVDPDVDAVFGQELPENPGVTGRFLLKRKGAYDAPSFVVEATSLVKSGEGREAVFTFYPDYSGPQLAAALSPNVDYVDLVAEIEFAVAGVFYRTLNNFEFRVGNSPNRGDENAANYPDGAPATSLPLVTRLTGGVSPTDLDALTLAAYAPLRLFEIQREINGALSASRWQKVPGDNLTDTDKGIIRTLDYNASTNPYVLVRVSGL